MTLRRFTTTSKPVLASALVVLMLLSYFSPLGGVLFKTEQAHASTLTTGLYRYWSLDEASGNRTDSVGSHVLTDNNTVGSAAGKIGNAADFVYANDETLSGTGATSIDMSAGLTVSYWKKQAGYTYEWGDLLIGDSFGGAGGGFYIGTIGSYINAPFAGAASNMSVYPPDPDTTAHGQSIIGTGWHHIVAWYDPATKQAHVTVDGVAEAGAYTDLVAHPVFANNQIVLGRDWYYTSDSGLIDEMGIWARVLTPGERAELYNGGAGISYADITYTPPGATAKEFSMGMSSSAPGAGNNLTLTFTTAQAVPAGLGKIIIDFPAEFTMNSVDYADMDLLVGGSDIGLAAASSGATWGVNRTGQTITFSSDTGTIGADTEVIIKIGTHASYGTTGGTQITNPSSTGSYMIHFETFDDILDEGDVWVAIVDPVWLTADVNSYFDFVVSGVSTGTYEGITTDVTSTDTAADFGTLTPNTAKVSASKLSAKTNAGSGFVVTVEQNHNLLASSGADIDSFKDGAASANTAWASPAATNGNADTYGHLGFNTTDNTVAGLTASANYFGLSGTAQQPVFSHPNPVSGGAYWSGTDVDGANSAYLFYKLEVSALQEPGHYQSRLMYIGTATF